MKGRFAIACAAEFGGFALLGAMVWWWLSITERRWWDIGVTAGLGVVIVALAAYLVSLAFSLGAPEPPNLFVRAWKRWPRVLPLLTAGALVMLWKPRWVTLLVLGVALTPLFHWACGGTGWLLTLKRPASWAAVVIWLAAGLYLPWRLIWWIPAVEGMPGQAASATVRFLAAALLFTGLTVWLGWRFWRTEDLQADPTAHRPGEQPG
jgi:hypothetical protein